MGFVVAALDLHPFGARLNKEVAHQLFSRVSYSRKRNGRQLQVLVYLLWFSHVTGSWERLYLAGTKTQEAHCNPGRRIGYSGEDQWIQRTHWDSGNLSAIPLSSCLLAIPLSPGIGMSWGWANTTCKAETLFSLACGEPMKLPSATVSGRYSIQLCLPWVAAAFQSFRNESFPVLLRCKELNLGESALSLICGPKVLGVFFTFGWVVDAVGWRCCHFQSQAIGSLEGVAVPDEEGAWFFVLQEGNGCSGTGRARVRWASCAGRIWQFWWCRICCFTKSFFTVSFSNH